MGRDRLPAFLCLAFCIYAASAQNSRKTSKPKVSLDDGKIVRGESALISQYPYQVSLQQNGRHFCGGSIIAPEWVLTAAHCTQGSSKNSIYIVAGSTNVKKQEDQAQKRRSIDIINHLKHNKRNADNDIALIKVDKPFNIGGDVQTTRIADEVSQVPEEVILSGWGTLKETGLVPENLPVTTIPAVSRENPRENYDSRRRSGI